MPELLTDRPRLRPRRDDGPDPLAGVCADPEAVRCAGDGSVRTREGAAGPARTRSEREERAHRNGRDHRIMHATAARDLTEVPG
ncbi:hypothetical protein QQY24_29735 [Streptomyces sp. TG1A-8]|uniref:hypothetical protein n=1 Tax=Streptomyces sp. TG1A-8 TaxID=3051385 RepID=UPI00265C827A|nr:hypothetical protein [Streptomyces sp. TG1A-8]MDO0929387.1 hypothetical protein [Streptomyces sp. TG1A-8]